MFGTAVAVSVNKLRPKPKSKSKQQTKSKPTLKEYLPSEPTKKKPKKPSVTELKNKILKNNLSLNLTAKRKKRLKKKEKRLANKELQKNPRAISPNPEEGLFSNETIPKRMDAFDVDENRELVLASDFEDDDSDSLPLETNQSKEDNSGTNSLVNNDDFIQFDQPENEANSTKTFNGEFHERVEDDSLKIPLVRSHELSDDEQEYAEPNINKKRKALKTKERPKKKHEFSYDFPWMNSGHDYSSYKEISDWLTKEIQDFVAYLSPSESEIRARNEAVQRIKTLVGSMWPDASVNVFGSYATDMYLPGSDIDIVITSPTGRLTSKSHLYQLSSKIKFAPGFAEKVTTIGKARVPIIKFVDSRSKIHIDISFERRNGLAAVEHIRKWAIDYPCLRHLVMPIKQFFASRRLNDVAVGGIGGYSIICTVVSFLAMHPRVSSGMIDPMNNLGPLLIEYFELYGKKFNYDRVAIRMDPSNIGYISKSKIPELCNSGPRPLSYSLVIEDPDDPSNNLGRSTYNILKIRAALSGAYEFVVSKCYELKNASKAKRWNQSIIGGILKVRGPERDFLDQRDAVENIAWSNKVDDDDDDDEYDNDDSNSNQEGDNGVFVYKAEDPSVIYETDDSDDDSILLNTPKPQSSKQIPKKQSSILLPSLFKSKQISKTAPSIHPVDEKRQNKLRSYFNIVGKDSDDDSDTESASFQKTDKEVTTVLKESVDYDEKDNSGSETETELKPEFELEPESSLPIAKQKKCVEISKSEKLLKQQARQRKMDYWSQKNSLENNF